MLTLSVNCYNVSPTGYQSYDHFRRAGFESVSIAYQSLEFDRLAADDWKDYAASIRRALDERGMRCVQTHLGYYDLTRDSDDSDPVTDKVMDRTVMLCGMLGARWGAYHCRTFFRDPTDERSFEANYKILRRLQPIAQDYGVGIAVENLPDYYDPAWGGAHLFATKYKDVIRLADAMEDPAHFGVCWDFGHAQMNHTDQTAALREIGSRLKATHVHSNSGFNDEHLPVALGTINWDEMMRALAEIGYDESLSLEVLWPGDRVSRTNFEMPGFSAAQEDFADEYFTFNYRCGVKLLEKLNRAKKLLARA